MVFRHFSCLNYRNYENSNDKQKTLQIILDLELFTLLEAANNFLRNLKRAPESSY